MSEPFNQKHKVNMPKRKNEIHKKDDESSSSSTVDELSKLISAIASLAGPAIALFLIIKLLPLIDSLNSNRDLKVKVGEFEVDIQGLTQDQVKQISDLQNQNGLLLKKRKHSEK